MKTIETEIAAQRWIVQELEKQHRRAGYNWHVGAHDDAACVRFCAKKNALIAALRKLVRLYERLAG
jgi:hypothetical protein